MALPAEGYPEWGNNQVDETVLIGGVSVLVTNKVAPTQEFKDSGLLAREPLPRPYTNYMFDLINRWISHLDKRYSVGDIHGTVSGESVGDISTRLGGTWVSIGAGLSLGTESGTVEWFKKTA